MSGHRHLLLVLALLQAALGLLAALGQLLFTGADPLYLVAPLARAVVLVVAGASGRRWGLVTVLALEGLSIAGFFLSGLVGTLPWVDTTVNLVGLLANLALPAVMLWLALRLLTAAREALAVRR